MSSEAADSSVIDRMKHLLSSGNGADVHFLVGKEGAQKEVIPAHKTILLAASDVFAAMFRFDAQNTKAKNASCCSTDEISSPVEVIDVEPAVFKAMLGYIYADDLGGLNGENAMELLYTARKYNVTALIKACLAFPIAKLRNIFLAFAYANAHGEEDFASRCLAYIDENVDTLLQSAEFLEIDQHLLCDIVGRDQLKITGEIDIWNAALRWADSQCRQNGIECSAENRREQLGPALHRIRFSLIPQEEFSKKIAPLGVLTSDELVGVYMAYHSVATTNSDNGTQPTALYPLKFPAERRALPASNSVAEDTEWSVDCSVTMRIVSRQSGTADYCKRSRHAFSGSSSNTWGYNEFMPLEYLLDVRNGLCRKDKVTLRIDVTVDGYRRMID